MSERTFEVKAVGVEYLCPVCKEGTMEALAGIALTTSPPLYPHSCTKCNSAQNLPVRYPTYRFVRADT